MTIHVTWAGVFVTIGAVTVFAVVGSVLYGVILLWRWGK